MLKHMRTMAVIGILSICACFNGGIQASENNAINIGSRLELFVDDFLIDRMDGTNLTMHHPQRAGVAITLDKPWEGIVSGYFTVIHDGDKYRMYYRGRPNIARADGSKEAQEVTCYAESLDGIKWTKPSLGLFEINGSRDNNVILGYEYLPATHNIAPFLDTRPGISASEKYKAVGGTGKTGLIAFVSGDGIHWKKLRDEPIITGGAFDSQNVIFWSENESCYVCYFRTFKNNVRWVTRTTSKDFLNWTPSVDMSFGDAPNEHIYINQTIDYFRAPHIYVGTAARFMPGRKALTDEQKNEIDLNNSQNYGKLDEACSDCVLLTSRGGNVYDRTFLESFVRAGRDPRDWVARANYPARGIVPTGPDEMSMYIQRRYGQPSTYIERLKMRTDGFASVHAPYTEGEMVTKPIRFDGSHLVLNYATSAAGGIRIELQDADGKPLPGYELDKSDEIIGDQIERVATWKGSANVGSLKGKAIRLRFVMKDADLYSIRFK